MQDIISGLGQALREVDPGNPGQMAEAETLASAVMASAMHFLQSRFGKDAAALAVNSMFEHVSTLVPAEGQPEQVGSSIPALHPGPHKEPASTIQGMAETMLGYLRGRESPAADAEARASIWAAAAFLQQREGERGALDYLSFIRSKIGLLGWFEQLPPASLSRH